MMQRLKIVIRGTILLSMAVVLVVCDPSNVAFATISEGDEAHKGDVNYYTHNGIIFYDGGQLYCGSGGNLVSGGAAAMLQKQRGLSAEWIPVILNEAKRAGADPIAMASLLFWENRGFPKYGDPGGGSDTIGRGPWQITKGTWPASAGPYATGVIDPLVSTAVAADIVKGWGGVAGSPIGSIDQDFSKGKNIPSMATVAKNYNAGRYTWREPGVAGYKTQGRVWMQPSGPWFAQKQEIIDDYILAMTYAYYLIATGESLPAKGSLNNDGFVTKAQQNAQRIKDFKVTDGGNVANGCDSATQGNGDIKNTAMSLGWPNRKYAENISKSVARPSYQQAMPKVQGGDPGNDAWTDCGVFTATVMRFSGADPKYQLRGTGPQLDYVRRNGNPNDPNRKYDVFDNYTNTGQTKEGDIFIVSGGNVGHTFIFTGNYTGDDNKKYDSMSASWHHRVPMAANAYFDQEGYHYHVARLRTNNNAAQTAGQGQ